MTVYPSSRTRSERTIATARVALAEASLFAVWMDPVEPARFAELTYTLYWAYVLWSILLAVYTWRWRGGDRLPIFTHSLDIVLFSVFQYFTLGPSSPFFIYFVFSIFCGAMRWGWKGTLATSAVVTVSFLLMTLSMAESLGPSEFQLNRVIIRIVYFVMAGGLLVYLGRYEARLRTEIDRLAHWPATAGTEAHVTVALMDHAAKILGAGRGVLVWDAGEEPAVHVTAWSPASSSVTRYPPHELTPLLPEPLARATFFCTGQVSEASVLLVNDARGRLVAHVGFPLHPTILAMIGGKGIASAAFHSNRISGRVLFTDMGTPTTEVVPLTEVVAREIGISLDQMFVAGQLQGIAAHEERLRLARDLHDGVLQSLTGIRLEIRAVAESLEDEDESVRPRLLALERALSIEQRELRFFIGGMKPAASAPGDDNSLASRLDSLRERLALEWKTPVSIRISPESQECSSALARAVPLMVHEAVVNALKHAQPTRVTVSVDSSPDRVRIVVSDDGRGFPIKGRFDHRSLDESKTGPRSLFERVTALGGKMSIESSDQGSRIEMIVSL